ncbi:MAG: hypothetical protein IPF62_01270 [Bacteroidetes bacterium]|jgi:hypothetical protein|nr:hypothetical protein [Bacteroidota bacterium]
MTAKKLVFVILFTCMAGLAQAQFLKIGGITVQATTTLFVDNGEAKSEECDQLYNVSFKDMMLAHNIYIGGVLNQSQFYQLNSVNRYMNGDITVLKFNALSGRSGMTYSYEIKIDADGKLMSLVCTEESGNKTTYKGGISELKTFKQ